MSSSASVFSPVSRRPSREGLLLQMQALRYLDTQWPAEMHIIPGLIWNKKRTTKYKRRWIPRLYALIMGTILGTRDDIERAVRLGHAAPGAELVERLRADAEWRENCLLAHVFDYNNGAQTDQYVVAWITELIEPATQDALEAFRWTQPLGAQLAKSSALCALARLAQTTEDVPQLNAPVIGKELTKRNLIKHIVEAAQAYLSDGSQHSDVLTFSHQFAVSLARFMATHDNNNTLPTSVSYMQ